MHTHNHAAAAPAERRVLLLYQPVYHPHLAIEPSTTVSTSSSASRSAANSRNVSPRESPRLNGCAGKKALTFQLDQEPALPSPPPAAEQQQHGMLHVGKSRSVPALQEAGKHVVEHLQERMAKGKAPSTHDDPSSSSGVTIDIFSILPASYTRSTHPAFNHNTSSVQHGSHSAHRTVSGSSSEGSGESASRRQSHSHHSHHHSQSRGHAALAGLAHLLHRYSPNSSATNSRAPSRRGSMHSHHSHYTPSISAHAASDALLQLTDVLRVEDEEAEEAREQLFDRLAILAGELDDGGAERKVNVDVRQAADGESLLEALHSLVKERGEGGYDELIVVNDSEWEEEEGPVAGVVAVLPASSTTSSSNGSPASTSGHNTPSLGGPRATTHASNPIPKKRKRLTFNLSKLHFPHHKAPLSWEEREKEQEQGRVGIAPLEIVRKDLRHDAETRKVEVIAM